jgi:hypothetical protein
MWRRGCCHEPKTQPGEQQLQKNALRRAKYRKALAYIVNMRLHLDFWQLGIVMISDGCKV